MYQFLCGIAIGYASCYVQYNGMPFDVKYVASKSIDYYVDGKNLFKRYWPPESGKKKSDDTSYGFWNSLRSNPKKNKFEVTYAKDGQYYKILSDSEKPNLSTNKSMGELQIVKITSEKDLNKVERQLLSLIISQWAGYSGDFHGNQITLADLELDLVKDKGITEIVVNTNLINETTLL